MNRTTCRAVGIVAGIVLGIYAAGVLEPVLPFVGVSLAETSHDDHGGDDTHRPADDEHANLAEPLMPQPEHITWYRPVLWGAVWLFAGALVIGGVSLKLRGPDLPEPPDPADSHDEHHDNGGGEHH